MQQRRPGGQTAGGEGAASHRFNRAGSSSTSRMLRAQQTRPRRASRFWRSTLICSSRRMARCAVVKAISNEKQCHQEPPRAAIPIKKRMDRLDLVVRRRGYHQWRQVRFVQESLQSTSQPHKFRLPLAPHPAARLRHSRFVSCPQPLAHPTTSRRRGGRHTEDHYRVCRNMVWTILRHTR